MHPSSLSGKRKAHTDDSNLVSEEKIITVADSLSAPIKEQLSDEIDPADIVLTEEEMERHTIFSLCLMKITAAYWNGNKYGPQHIYPLNPPSTGSYLGHNIASFIVTESGKILDFEFNHNEVFNSSVDHAEARLMKRAFSLNQLSISWKPSDKTDDERSFRTRKMLQASVYPQPSVQLSTSSTRSSNVTATSSVSSTASSTTSLTTLDKPRHEKTLKYGNMFKKATVYTTLESCTQCTGIMNLGNVESVVYLQSDPGMNKIGNIVWNLTKKQTDLKGPKPIEGNRFGFFYQKLLDNEYQEFKKAQDQQKGQPFVEFSGEGDKKQYTSSITSFLCTKKAFGIFSAAAKDFDQREAVFPKNKPFLEEAKTFAEYAISRGCRATPHR